LKAPLESKEFILGPLVVDLLRLDSFIIFDVNAFAGDKDTVSKRKKRG
jgi:hypothetical protein